MSGRVLLACIAFVRTTQAAAPAVSKVEPPDWITEPNAVTLRLLLTGENLEGASLHGRFSATAVKISPTGTHLFADLTIPANTPPGSYPLRIVSSGGTLEAPFAIVPKLAPAGRFQGFSSDDVMYLIMPDRFANGDPSNDDPAISRGLFDRSKSHYYHGGDFEGIIQHLDYLKSLGVTALWLTPIYDNSNKLNQRERSNGQAITDYHGYGAVDFYSVDEHFGTLDKFRELVDKAHALGIKIIQDQVANHTGPYHSWAEDPPTQTWFNGTPAAHLTNTFRIWTITDPHATPATRKSTLDGWFAGILPDLNQGDPEVARYLIQNTLWWIGRTGIDGIRQDTLPYVPRTFWRDWTSAIKKRYPHFNVVGEVFDSDAAMESFFQGGKARFDGVDDGIDTLFDFPLHSVIRKVFTGAARTPGLPQVISHDYLYTDANRLVTFVDLHDISRFMSEPGASLEALQRVFAFLMTIRGIPLVYYGDEIGMQGGNDPDNRRDFPGGWKEDLRNAFEPAGRTPQQERLLAYLQRLGRLRAELRPLRKGAMIDLLVGDNAYAFARVVSGNTAGNAPEQPVLVVFNNAAAAATVHVPLAGSGIVDGVSLHDLLGAAEPVKTQNGAADVSMPAHSAAIYR